MVWWNLRIMGMMIYQFDVVVNSRAVRQIGTAETTGLMQVQILPALLLKGENDNV